MNFHEIAGIIILYINFFGCLSGLKIKKEKVCNTNSLFNVELEVFEPIIF